MEDIYFNHRKNLEEIHQLYYWNYGSEGVIYRIPDGKRNILMKIFFDHYNRKPFPIETMQNKKRKIDVLKNITLPNRVQVEGRIFLQDKFIGYLLGEAMNFHDFSLNTFTTFQKLEFLKRLRNQLTRFHELGIIYGDLKSDNVLAHYSNYKLGCLCDLDNAQIGNLPIDIKSDYVDEFLYQYGEVDAMLDWYAFNLFTLETIYGLDKTSCTAYEETRSYMDQYKGSCEALRKMQHITPQYEGSLLIDEPEFYKEIGIQYYKKN